MGATFIETDLQLSRDARFVAIHDDTVNRTTDGRGKVHDLSLAELRQLDAGSWFGKKFHEEHISTLDEVLEEIGTRFGGHRARSGQGLLTDGTHQARFTAESLVNRFD